MRRACQMPVPSITAIHMWLLSGTSISYPAIVRCEPCPEPSPASSRSAFCLDDGQTHVTIARPSSIKPSTEFSAGRPMRRPLCAEGSNTMSSAKKSGTTRYFAWSQMRSLPAPFPPRTSRSPSPALSRNRKVAGAPLGVVSTVSIMTAAWEFSMILTPDTTPAEPLAPSGKSAARCVQSPRDLE